MTPEAYREVIERIVRARQLLAEVRLEPESPKRDVAIEMLEERLAQAILAVRHLDPSLRS